MSTDADVSQNVNKSTSSSTSPTLHTMSLSADIKRHFPLTNLNDVLGLFRKQMQLPEPNLTLLSIVSGFLETTIIARYNESQAGDSDSSTPSTFPVVEWDLVEALHKKFHAIVSVEGVTVPGGGKSAKGPNKTTTPPVATRETIKRVSDIIWNSLIRSTYKDRAHLQSLYSLLTTNKLDCFGVAFAVVAGCQLLGYLDVNLAISEDHAWVVFGPENGDRGRETIEITWHGKGFEDKRGESVGLGLDSQSWLYLSGHPVVCDRFMEVSAAVLAINPSLNLTSACLEVTELQKRLLWLLYDHGHLQKYPMGLGNLGELEEFSPTRTEEARPKSEQLYRLSVRSARKWYKNYHVYPYTYQGSYYSRKQQYREAFRAWANAGHVIRKYVYTRDDEEIYKELLDIANEQLPQIMKTESSGHSAKSILRDPNCFASLLRFYDGICKWEEGSMTPILHIGWAKPFGSTMQKFDYDIRSKVIITAAADDEEMPDVEDWDVDKRDEEQQDLEEERKTNAGTREANNNVMRTANNNSSSGSTSSAGSLPATLAALTAACGEKLLNPNFLTGGEVQPFKSDETEVVVLKGKEDNEQVVVVKSEEGTVKREDVLPSRAATPQVDPQFVVAEDDDDEPKRPRVKLYSQKMKGMKNLLLAEKLNSQAILLQITAQSQVGQAGKKMSRGWSANDGGEHSAGGEGKGTGVGASNSALGDGGVELTNSGRPKRTRRE